jgi:hypothetical protein
VPRLFGSSELHLHLPDGTLHRIRAFPVLNQTAGFLYSSARGLELFGREPDGSPGASLFVQTIKCAPPLLLPLSEGKGQAGAAAATAESLFAAALRAAACTALDWDARCADPAAAKLRLDVEAPRLWTLMSASEAKPWSEYARQRAAGQTPPVTLFAAIRLLWLRLTRLLRCSLCVRCRC